VLKVKLPFSSLSQEKHPKIKKTKKLQSAWVNPHVFRVFIHVTSNVSPFPGRGTARRRRRVRSRRVASCGSQRCQKQRPRQGDSGF
jgi:hypothetical protein